MFSVTFVLVYRRLICGSLTGFRLTRPVHLQALMERFNADKRIFCFILSTRSGGVGVNLTGADTVVFYDSDWNPTMDAQAQDRCHRIGQTRDVHIYRLVSDKTIEENIVKKANQKRLLGDLAIEGGNFTTAFFKKNTLQDLFNVDMKEDDASRRMSDAARRRPDKIEVRCFCQPALQLISCIVWMKIAITTYECLDQPVLSLYAVLVWTN